MYNSRHIGVPKQSNGGHVFVPNWHSLVREGSFLKATSKHWAGKFSHRDGKGGNMQKVKNKKSAQSKKKIKTRYQTVVLSIFFNEAAALMFFICCGYIPPTRKHSPRIPSP